MTVKLLLSVFCAVLLTLKGAHTLEAAIWLADVNIAGTQLLHNSRFLDLLLEPLLQAVIALFAAFVGMNSHMCGGA